MGGPGAGDEATEAVADERRTVLLAVVVAVIGAVAVLGTLLVRDLREREQPPPSFPSLAADPDQTLHGTIAYLAGSQKGVGLTTDGNTDGKATGGQTTGGKGEPAWCVRAVAAAGSPARNVLCIAASDLEGMVGPQLRWRTDDRLEVTMFRAPEGEDGSVSAGWQRLVDVRTGAVEEVPAADVPDSPASVGDPRKGPNGEQVTASSDDGHVEVVLKTSSGSRTLLSASGSPSYSVQAGPYWSPDGSWILVDDGRLLLVTTGRPARTRILADDPSAYGDVRGSDIRTVAVTDHDLLGPGG